MKVCLRTVLVGIACEYAQARGRSGVVRIVQVLREFKNQRVSYHHYVHKNELVHQACIIQCSPSTVSKKHALRSGLQNKQYEKCEETSDVVACLQLLVFSS